MEYLKYILLVIGLVLIMYARMQYTKRAVTENDQTQPYGKKEKIILYTGYTILALSIASVILIK